MTDKYIEQPTEAQRHAMQSLLRRVPLMASHEALFHALVNAEYDCTLTAGKDIVSCFACHRIGSKGMHEHAADCPFAVIYPEIQP